MNSFVYFAYGSNMLTQRLQARCKSARAKGMASVTGYRLAFSKRSKDGSGKATLVAVPDGQVIGAAFEIAADDVKELDQIEGRGKGYERIEELAVLSFPDGQLVSVTTYIAHDDFLNPALQPYDWYRDLVVKGAEQHHVPDAYLATLRAIPALADPDPMRPTRLEALAILASLEPSR
ncbi:MAG: gamma-glutamylcyclotransferase, partial [Hyphomicrobium sp.]|nr:gamma-glutamylcyclotransferase [Hyphomicrobium sp.]